MAIFRKFLFLVTVAIFKKKLNYRTRTLEAIFVYEKKQDYTEVFINLLKKILLLYSWDIAKVQSIN